MSTLPSFNIPEVERRRDRIVARLANQLDSDVDIDKLTEGLLRALPASVSRDAVFESARYLAGRKLVSKDATRLAWRLAGNIKLLKEGQSVAPWTVQQFNEWVPLQILRCYRTKDRKDRLAFDFQLRVLAGSSCAMNINAMWGPRVVRMVAYKIGFSRWGKYPFKDASDLVGLRFLGYVEAKRSRSFPEFHEVECPTSMVTRNRNDVLKLRLRVDETRCPKTFTHPCRVCAIGYDQCAAGTHYYTYTLGQCNNCGTQAPFDQGDPSPYCVECSAQIRLRSNTTE